MEFINILNSTLWTWLVIPMLVGCAVWFTIRLGGLQFRSLPLMLKQLTEEAETLEHFHGKKRINSFHAFAISLASRIGTGNLAGVASAIAVGGPGAIFWMWIMALLGSATAFAEATLAQLYKRKGQAAFYGGPAYYMRHGLHNKWMGIVFSICLAITFGLANQIMQSNQICVSLGDTMGIEPFYLTIGLAVLAALIIFGGVHRIASFTSVVVPMMAVMYLLVALYIIVAHYDALPKVMMLIIRSAFGWEQAAGGAIGITIMQGVKRGLFSNEAGEGSAPNAAAVADTSHPVCQGLVQALGVFVDTLVICTCTAMIILLSGVYSQGEADGILLTTRALETTMGGAARIFISTTIFLFAFSTIIGNYYYGETAIRYVSHRRGIFFGFRMATIAVIVVGGILSLDTIWSLLDLCMCSIVILNVYALLRLSPKVKMLWADYQQQIKEGKKPRFHKKQMLEEACDLDAW